jgi:hypothetical protein
MKTTQFTSEEIRTLYFACLDKLDTLETLIEDKPTMEESIQSEITCLQIIKHKLAYAK